MFVTISMAQLENMLNGSHNFTLLDVRERSEFEKGHLEGAVNIPLSGLEDGLEVIPRERPVVIYCSHGGQSLLASKKLAQLGYDVVNTSGGLYYYRGTHLI